MEKLDEILFPEDSEKVVRSVVYHPMGSYQLGEVARLSSLLYDRGIDVTDYLESLCRKHGVSTK
ncbi:hypothetical protein [Halobacillus litoralis]|uniref:hypothetical protein n=1 Tax=Halobacillus litoralis TaxID=45668 RepID=UPI001CD22AA0|nr:hypothetical protein [Halobacillus litoralis]MCA1021576.1 hypothetical protein [Halobacillus litoralis]